MPQTLEYYLNCFSNLRTDTSKSRWSETTHHRAPHKPLLLLSVIDLFAQNTFEKNFITLTPDLYELFTLYWSHVMPADKSGNIALPFYHLKSDGFWHLLPRPNKKIILEASRQIRSANQLREIVLGARLDKELYKYLCIEKDRGILQSVLIKGYFSPQARKALIDQGKINEEAFQYSKLLLERAMTKKVKDGGLIVDQCKPVARYQGFRRVVVNAYEHRCALCAIRMITADGHTVVDAAHIIPWSLSHNDDPRNGMALCRLCHWTFDQGLVGVSSQYEVITSPQIISRKNVPGHLLTLTGRGILGPAEKSLWPDLKAIAWHKKHIFRMR